MDIGAIAGAAFAGLTASFLGINFGLRASPEGRRFLAKARGTGRLVSAYPRRTDGAPGGVRRIFALSYAAGAAIFAGALGVLG